MVTVALQSLHLFFTLHMLLAFSSSPEGDGANDVSMIQVADIGIGISGQEGMQVSGFRAPKYRELHLPIQGQHSHGEISVVK